MTAKVRAHTRAGRPVKAHTRKTSGRRAEGTRVDSDVRRYQRSELRTASVSLGLAAVAFLIATLQLATVLMTTVAVILMAVAGLVFGRAELKRRRRRRGRPRGWLAQARYKRARRRRPPARSRDGSIPKRNEPRAARREF